YIIIIIWLYSCIYLPGPPDGPLKVKVVSAEKCNLHWNPPVNDGGACVSHYIIEKRETSRVTWTGVDAHVEAVSYKVTKLVPGKEYIFRVAAVNKFGVGEFLESEPFIAQNPFTTPSAPSTPAASAVTGDSIALTWERPESDGGSEIDGYILEKRDKEGVRWTKCNKRRLNDLRFRCTGLTEGHYYQFRVLAENAAGVGAPKTTEAVKVSEAPLPPGKITLSDVTCNSARLSWEKPDHDGGSKITCYIVEMQAEGDDTWTICSESKALEVTVTGLTKGKEYFFRVSNMAGVGPCSKASDPVAARDQCDPPCNLTVTNITNSSVSLSWNKPEYDGGAKIIGYIVERKELPDSCWLKCNFTNLMDTFLEVTGLTEGEQYDFRVIAKNSAELFSAPSETTGPVTVQHDVEPPKIILEDKLRQVGEMIHGRRNKKKTK
uniref:Fibronectin type-III domain-containing protein n=1 Tax=Seriola dumerili TaxID=41447 RepID=A0A3B4V077_SERDU